MVVALEHPATAPQVGRREQRQQLAVPDLLWFVLERRRQLPGDRLRLVARRLVREEAHRDRAYLLVVEVRAQLPGARDLADDREAELPLPADLLDGRELGRRDDCHHSLLALREHDLDGCQLRLAQGDAVEVDVEADTSAACHLGEGRGEAGGPQVLEGLDQPALGQLQARLDQLLAGERIADLHGRPLVLVLAGELLAGEDAGPADAVSPRGGAVEDDEVARAGRRRPGHPLGREEADAHGVDQRVPPVGVVEDRLAAHRRDADAVAVVPDPPDGPLEGEVVGAEAQPVEKRDRARAHRDDVAEDAPDAGGRALEGLDGGGMVVALHLEGARQALAEVDDARILARALQHRRAFHGKPPQQPGRVLVAAVLGPEEREDAEFEVVRIAPEQASDTVELPVGQTERAVERLFRHGAQRRPPLYRPGRSVTSSTRSVPPDPSR